MELKCGWLQLFHQPQSLHNKREKIDPDFLAVCHVDSHFPLLTNLLSVSLSINPVRGLLLLGRDNCSDGWDPPPVGEVNILGDAGS